MFKLMFGLILYGLIQSTQSLDNCDNESPDCIVATIQEMSTRFNYLIYNRSCNHNAVFIQVYLIMTQYVAKYLTTVAANGSLVFSDFYDNPPFMVREDRIFANYYFNAIDYWTSGNKSLVPQAWKIAFEAADNREMSALGDALLTINAHINRDLPFVLESVGLTYPDGASGKDDYDLTNGILSEATYAVVDALATEYDPTYALLYDPATNALLQQTIMTARNNAWNNAERLINSNWSSILHSIVSSDIETEANTIAAALRVAFRANSSNRDALCRRVFGVSLITN